MKVGAQPGNKNSAKGRIWHDAIRRALARREKGKPDKLNRLADALITEALDGDIQALKEFGDRIDGKVPQGIEGPGENGEHIVNVIERKIIDGKR